MKLLKWIQIILIVSCVLALTACSHTRRMQGDQSDINQANAAGAEASGLGQESGFGDRGGMGERAMSKNTYYFDFDSNVVHSDDKPAIEANANFLLSHPRAKVLLEGHTDPRGSREYNIGLGERRAQAVAAILVNKGVNSDQIRVVSYGAEKLAAMGHSEADYQQDRRVVLVYLKR